MNVAAAIKRVALNMSLVTGQGMQPYSNDQIGQYLADAHDMITSKWVWPEMVTTLTRTLDGTTGKPTVAFSPSDGITDYKQIVHVYVDSVRRELPLSSGYQNPLLQVPLVSYSVLSIANDPLKQFFIQINPVTTVGNLAIVANLKADLTDPNTVIPIDDLLHVYLASWMYAVDDATNPGQVEKYLNLYNDRATVIRDNVNTGPYSLNPFNGPIEQWFEYF